MTGSPAIWHCPCWILRTLGPNKAKKGHWASWESFVENSIPKKGAGRVRYGPGQQMARRGTGNPEPAGDDGSVFSYTRGLEKHHGY